MANNSSGYLTPALYIYVIAGSADHMIGLLVSCWALLLIVSGKRSLIASEILTVNLVIMEIACSLNFFL